MPFTSVGSDERPTIHLQPVTETRFRLLTPFRYVDRSGAIHEVPRHEPPTPSSTARHVYTDQDSTDLASVPPLLWGMLASYGRHTLPALLHDHQCVVAARYPSPARFAARRDADRIFRESLREEGVEWFRRWLFWAGVSIGRYGSHRRLGLFALVGHLVVAWVLIALSLVAAADDGASGLVRIGLPLAGAGSLALAGLWRDDWPLVVVGILAGPVAAASLVATAVFAFALRLPDILVWVVRLVRRRGAGVVGPFPFPRPTTDDLLSK